MKKYFFAAILCCAAVFTACNPIVQVSDSYSYDVRQDIVTTFAKNEDVSAIQNALVKATNNGQPYSSNQDAAVKQACENVVKQFASIESVYVRFYLVRYFASANNAAARQEEVIGTYAFGAATRDPYVSYSYASTAEEVTNALKAEYEAKGDSATENETKIYKASRRTVLALTSGFDKLISKLYGPWFDYDVNDKHIQEWCDSIYNAHAKDTLTMEITFAAYKKGYPEGEKAELWRKARAASIPE
ncbi:MAG: hypothetical protein J5669_06600 [Bacteroidales bacterium]|nr:hypothetical protein [Bacteroidales bacterium]